MGLVQLGADIEQRVDSAYFAQPPGTQRLHVPVIWWRAVRLSICPREAVDVSVDMRVAHGERSVREHSW